MSTRDSVLAGIPAARRRIIEAQLSADGATIESTQMPDGTWTIRASFPNFTSAATRAIPRPSMIAGGCPTGARSVPIIAPLRDAPELHWLGTLSEQYETAGRGPDSLCPADGDASGVAYGSYRLSGTSGGMVAKFVVQNGFPWRNEFIGLAPGSAPFTAKWITIARADPQRFHSIERAFIKRTYFDPLVARILIDEHLDIATRTRVAQNVVWSTAVQHGPNSPVAHRAIQALKRTGAFDPNAAGFDRALIVAIYWERARKNGSGALLYFSQHAAVIQATIAQRFAAEQQAALNRLDAEM